MSQPPAVVFTAFTGYLQGTKIRYCPSPKMIAVDHGKLQISLYACTVPAAVFLHAIVHRDLCLYNTVNMSVHWPTLARTNTEGSLGPSRYNIDIMGTSERWIGSFRKSITAALYLKLKSVK